MAEWARALPGKNVFLLQLPPRFGNLYTVLCWDVNGQVDAAAHPKIKGLRIDSGSTSIQS